MAIYKVGKTHYGLIKEYICQSEDIPQLLTMTEQMGAGSWCDVDDTDQVYRFNGTEWVER